MSKVGVKRAAKAFADLQNAREELLRMGTKNPSTKECKQDILLGHLMNDGNDAMKEQFMRIVDYKFPTTGKEIT